MMGYEPKTMQTKPDVLLLSYTLILLAVRFFLKLFLTKNCLPTIFRDSNPRPFICRPNTYVTFSYMLLVDSATH